MHSDLSTNPPEGPERVLQPLSSRTNKTGFCLLPGIRHPASMRADLACCREKMLPPTNSGGLRLAPFYPYVASVRYYYLAVRNTHCTVAGYSWVQLCTTHTHTGPHGAWHPDWSAAVPHLRACVHAAPLRRRQAGIPHAAQALHVGSAHTVTEALVQTKNLHGALAPTFLRAACSMPLMP